MCINVNIGFRYGKNSTYRRNQKIKTRIQVAEDIAGAPLTEYSHDDRLLFWEQAKLELRKNKR